MYFLRDVDLLIRQSAVFQQYSIKWKYIQHSIYVMLEKLEIFAVLENDSIMDFNSMLMLMLMMDQPKCLRSERLRASVYTV